MKSWVVKARHEAARELKALRRVGERDYQMAIEKAMKRYGSLEDVSMAEVKSAASAAKKEWRHIEGKVKKVAKMAAAKVKKPAKRSVHRKTGR